VKRPLEGPWLVDEFHARALQHLLQPQTHVLGNLPPTRIKGSELAIEFVEEIHALLSQLHPGFIVDWLDGGA